jgi:hypothetical protein
VQPLAAGLLRADFLTEASPGTFALTPLVELVTDVEARQGAQKVLVAELCRELDGFAPSWPAQEPDVVDDGAADRTHTRVFTFDALDVYGPSYERLYHHRLHCTGAPSSGCSVLLGSRCGVT